MIDVQLSKRKPIFKFCNYDNNRKEKLKIKQLLKITIDNQISAKQKNLQSNSEENLHFYTKILEYWLLIHKVDCIYCSLVSLFKNTEGLTKVSNECYRYLFVVCLLKKNYENKVDRRCKPFEKESVNLISY